MGYRSQVVIALGKIVVADLILLGNQKPELLDRADYTYRDNDGNSYYSWEEIKWYVNYDDVDELNTFLLDLDDDQYGFIRVGEDSDDVETGGNYWDFDMYVSTVINSPLSGERM